MGQVIQNFLAFVPTHNLGLVVFDLDRQKFHLHLLIVQGHLQHRRIVVGAGIAAKNKVAQGVDDRATAINFGSLQDMGMVPYHQIGPVVDREPTELSLPVRWIGGRFLAPVIVHHNPIHLIADGFNVFRNALFQNRVNPWFIRLCAVLLAVVGQVGNPLTLDINNVGTASLGHILPCANVLDTGLIQGGHGFLQACGLKIH